MFSVDPLSVRGGWRLQRGFCPPLQHRVKASLGPRTNRARPCYPWVKKTGPLEWQWCVGFGLDSIDHLPSTGMRIFWIFGSSVAMRGLRSYLIKELNERNPHSPDKRKKQYQPRNTLLVILLATCNL